MEMSDDEVMCLALFGGAGAVTLGLWYARVVGVASFGRHRPARWPLVLAPAACLALLWTVLSRYADDEVRSHLGYRLLFTGSWAVAAWALEVVGRLLGVEPIAQGLERRNPAALWAGVGIWLGATLAMAGSNIGEGPTIYTTLGPSLLAMASLAALWVVFDGVTGNGHALAVDRDTSAGIRLAALLTAWGLILGRAVAGDWESVEGLSRDLAATAWPTAAILAVAAAIERALRPTPEAPHRDPIAAGLIPAALSLAMAVGWLAWVGGWDGRSWSDALAGPS